MNGPTLAFCIISPIFFSAIAVITHLVQCHTERLRRAHFSPMPDYARCHYSALPDFVNGDTK